MNDLLLDSFSTRIADLDKKNIDMENLDIDKIKLNYNNLDFLEDEEKPIKVKKTKKIKKTKTVNKFNTLFYIICLVLFYFLNSYYVINFISKYDIKYNISLIIRGIILIIVLYKLNEYNII